MPTTRLALPNLMGVSATVLFAALQSCSSDSSSNVAAAATGGAAGMDASAGSSGHATDAAAEEHAADAGAGGSAGHAGAAGAAGQAGAGGSASPTPLWPFDRPSLAQLAASPRKVIAHWHWFPLSFDNADASKDYYTDQFINPHGESDKHYAYGGYLRERPLGRLPRSESDWTVRDMTRDAAFAQEIGVDAFFLNMWTDTGNLWDRNIAVLDGVAALQSGFKVAPNLDMTLIAGATDKDKQDLVVSMLGKLKTHPALLWTDDQRMVVGAFKAEDHAVAFYQQLFTRLKTELQVSVFFVPVFLGNGGTYVDSFAPISDAIAGWGTAIPEQASVRKAFVDHIHGLGKLAVPPMLPQDFRPHAFAYWEASNSLALRTLWEGTIAAQADWAQIVTWNDHAEHHALRPSTGKQWAPYDLTAYYVSWFKTGIQPPIVRDALYYFHRIESTSASPDLTKQTQPFELKAGTATNEVELLAFLVTPGRLEIELAGAVQTQDAPAGLTSFRIPLSSGRPKFRLVRGSTTAIELVSAFDIRDSITFQDLLYRSGGSLRAALHESEDCKALCEGKNADGCLACASEPVWLVANP